MKVNEKHDQMKNPLTTSKELPSCDACQGVFLAPVETLELYLIIHFQLYLKHGINRSTRVSSLISGV